MDDVAGCERDVGSHVTAMLQELGASVVRGSNGMTRLDRVRLTSLIPTPVAGSVVVKRSFGSSLVGADTYGTAGSGSWSARDGRASLAENGAALKSGLLVAETGGAGC